MSCSTKASRWAGVSVSSTTSSANPTEVGQQGFVLGVASVRVADDRVGDVYAEGLLAPCLARAQHVQTHPRHYRGQPRSEVLDPPRVSATQAQPGFLDGVVGLAERAEHPVGHRPEPSPVCLETLGQPGVLVHQVTFLRRGVSYQ